MPRRTSNETTYARVVFCIAILTAIAAILWSLFDVTVWAIGHLPWSLCLWIPIAGCILFVLVNVAWFAASTLKEIKEEDERAKPPPEPPHPPDRTLIEHDRRHRRRYRALGEQ
jgi:hypothetical protein